MAVLKNNKEVYLMTYEPNEKKRNTNKVITFVSRQGVYDLDVIKAGSEEIPSNYTIEKITKERPASLNGYNHYTAISNWNR